MADISKITLPSGSSYDLKDAGARKDIEDLKSSLTGAMHYEGITTTALTDGSTTNPITVDGKSVTVVAGAVAIYGEKEYVWNGSKWQEFGSTGSLKALAFKDNASATYKPAGTVSKPSFTGASMTSAGKFTPSGTVSAPTITVTPNTTNVKATASGTAVGVASSGNAITGLGTPSTEKFVKSYPGHTTTVPNVTNKGSASTWAFSVADETLQISGANGSAPTLGAAISVLDGLGTATTGDGVTGYASPSKETFAKTVSVTAQPTIALATGATAGTGVVSVATGIKSASSTQPSFTGTEGDVSVEGTTTGSVSQPTFTGTSATITAS